MILFNLKEKLVIKKLKKTSLLCEIFYQNWKSMDKNIEID